MSSPQTWADWLSAANERAGDAEAVLAWRADSVGSVYLAGYAVECSLKGYLQRIGRPVPRSGGEGHHLGELWKSSSFRLADLNDQDGAKSFYIHSWTTDLRYETELDAGGLNTQALLSGAKVLTGWIQQRVRRISRPGRIA